MSKYAVEFLGDILPKFFEQHMIFPRKFVCNWLIDVKLTRFKYLNCWQWKCSIRPMEVVFLLLG